MSVPPSSHPLTPPHPHTLPSSRLMLAILLLATAFRFAALFDSPPGWRDDELIELDMDLRIRDGWRPLYITEAEGHEPLYHYLHAATIALFGENVAGYKWLPMAFGVVSLALTYALARRLFGTRVAIVAAGLMAVSFWPIMYARLGLRHVGLLPWMLGVYYVASTLLVKTARALNHRDAENTEFSGSIRSAFIRVRPRSLALPSVSQWLIPIILGGICLAAGLMTYFAGRVVPIVVIAVAVYALLFHRDRLRRAWFGLLILLGVGGLLAAPMFIEINRLAPGGEQRLEVVGPQLTELRAGDLGPALETMIGTLGMFTFRGDPEALYNIEGRPVFDWLTGAFFYAGLAIALWRWRRAEYGFNLIAFGLGLAPAFVSNPPASFSHTIAAIPLTYILAALGIAQVSTWLELRLNKITLSPSHPLTLSPFHLIALSLLLLTTWLTVRDYFIAWPQDAYVRFLYHAPIRHIAHWLDASPEVKDIAVSTHPNYLRLEPLALRLDLKRDDVYARWFDAELATLYPAGGGWIVGTTLNAAQPDCCVDAPPAAEGQGFVAWRVSGDAAIPDPAQTFDGRLTLLDIAPLDRLWLDVTWRADAEGLPATIKTFAHVVDDGGDILAQFDGMGVYLPSLRAGDVFVQHLDLERPVASRVVRIGLYDSVDNVRLRLPDGREFIEYAIP